MIKILFTDFDGTYMLHDYRQAVHSWIPKENLEKTAEFEREGGRLVVTTGRGSPSVLRQMEEYGLAGDMIGANGSAIRKYGFPIEVRYHDPQILEPMFRDIIALNSRVDYNHFDNDTVNFHFANLDGKLSKDGKEYQEYLEIIERTKATTNKCSVKTNTPGELDEIEEMLRSRYGSKITLSEPSEIQADITAAGVNKGAAIDEMLAYYGIKREEAAGIGDGRNDKAIMDKVSIRFAMASGHPDLIKYCDYTVNSVAEALDIIMEINRKEQKKMRKRLVYRADDIGYTLAFDLGAFKAIDEGIVTSADVMFDSPHTEEALRWLRERPWISVGWHRHLWESPVLPPEKVPHMVNEKGRFAWGHRNRKLMDLVPYEEAYAEFKAEMQRCYDILGKYPDTCNVQFEPQNELERAFKDVCEECGINCNVSMMGKQNPKFAHLKYASWIIHPNGNIMRGDQMVRMAATDKSEYDLSYFKDYDMVRNIKTISWDNEDQIWMTGGHPGYLDEHILQESTCTIHRCEELRGAISPETKQWIIDNKIELVNQRDVIYGTSEYQDHLKEINSPLWVGNFDK